MSFFDWQGIPEDLLRVQGIEKTYETIGSSEENVDSSSEEDTDSSSECHLDDEFESDITTLRDYSFIATSENSSVFTMHRLVQLTVRTWLKTYRLEEEWKERSIKNLDTEFPTGEYEHWERCRSLFPHVRSAVSHRPKSQDSLRSWAAILYRGAWYAKECGNISDSREMAYISRKERIKIGGEEDKEAVNSTAMLAEVYRFEGRLEEAEKLEVQVMEICKTKLGADHLDTLTSMSNLALTFWKQGRWEEAEKLQVQVIETSKIKLGVDHPDTLTTMSNLSFTWKSIGQHAKAIDLLRTCVVKISGTSYPIEPVQERN
ncbi:hypothetical protein N7491_000587 [Penicillium cf. griseofulvum]|nr:hypothetical protein N7491_000587 [Penicillium cf. griseofulvum]